MKHLSEAQKDVNVIKLNFKQSRDEIPHEIAHPASKNYPEHIDDPIEDLLGEFEDIAAEPVERQDYIYNHQKNWDFQIQYQDDLNQMMAKVGRQIMRLKEDTKRLKYYLDELDSGLED
jgi:hypothetical protein